MSKFISFEGVDGSGKSTQVRKIKQWLVEKGLAVVATEEPNDETTLKLRSLFKRLTKPLLPETEALLFLAERLEHTEKMIKPALQQGKIVLVDRYHDSSLVYQAPKCKTGLIDFLAWQNKLLTPRLTFWLDAPPKVLLARIQQRIEQGEQFKYFEQPLALEARLQSLREQYQQLHRMYPKRIQRIDCSPPTDEVAQQIQAQLSTLLVYG